MIAANTGRADVFFLAWLAGGIISLIGALCYAELATAYPHTGGDYHYLTWAFGRQVGFLFVWSRMEVIQPGSIAILTALNVMGSQKGKWTQNLLTAIKLIRLISVIVVSMMFPCSSAPMVAVDPNPEASFGLAMVLVLLTFGRWNEAAYISAELHEGQKSMVRALLWGIGIITVIYLLLNLAYLRGLGLREMGQSKVVAADLIRRILGQGGAKFISLLIVTSSLGAINASLFTGCRTEPITPWDRISLCSVSLEDGMDGQTPQPMPYYSRGLLL